MKKTLVTIVVGILVMCVLPGQEAWATKVPSSPEEVKNLSDEELRALLNEWWVTFGRTHQAWWAFMGREFGIGNLSSFKQKMPSTAAWMIDNYRKATASGGMSSSTGQLVTGDDVCAQLGKIEVTSDIAMAIANSALVLAGFIYSQEYTTPDAEAGLTRIRNDFTRTCPECEESEVDLFVNLFIRESATLAYNSDAWKWVIAGALFPPANVHAYVMSLCMAEACARRVGWILYCIHYPNNPECERQAKDRGPCFGGGGGNLPIPNPDYRPEEPGQSSGPGGPGQGSPGSISQRVTTICIGFCDTIDVTDKFPRLPERDPGRRGGVVPPGEFFPFDPTKQCFGPCCDGPRGGRQPNKGQCFMDGMPVPCEFFF